MKSNDTNQCSINFALYYLSGIVILTLLGFVLRLLFYIYNQTTFGSLSLQQLVQALFNGLSFDSAVAALAMLLLLIPFWLLSRFNLSQFWYQSGIYIVAILITLIQTSDSLYFSDAGRHVSYEIKDALVDASGLLITAILQHGWFILVSFIIASITLFTAIRFFIPTFQLMLGALIIKLPRLLRFELLFFCLFFISVVLVRGGISGIPQEPLSAFKSGNTAQGQMTLNGAYSITHRLLGAIEEVKQVPVPAPKGLTVQQLKNKLNPAVNTSGLIQEHNIIIVFLESWQAAQMKSYGGKHNTTPYFDHLRTNAISPDYVYAGGYRTTEGLFSTLCSFQNPLGNTVAQSQLQSFDYLCLPHILKNNGWETAFFQGSNKNTSGTGIFAQRLGFTNSYGKNDILHLQYEHNAWGAHDPDLYQFVLEKTKTLKEPFLLGINTTSTHDDTLPKSFNPLFGMKNKQQRYQSILNFADQSLEKFITHYQAIQREKKTIFVLIADHTAGTFDNKLSRVLIPGIIYSPEINLTQPINRAVHQRDFAPTVLDLLNINSPASFSGHSLLQTKSSLWDAEFYNTGHLSVVKEQSLTDMNLQNQNISCFRINYPELTLNQAVCSAKDNLIMNLALGFTQYSQNLLFTGKTIEFDQTRY